MKLGLLGTGHWGKHYVRLLPEFGKLVIMHRKIDPNVDAVIIATPASTHFDYIKQALRADKHILVEKPMVLSSKEAREVKELMDNKVFMVGHQYCYNDAIREFINKPIKEISLEHSISPEQKNAYWEIAPHLFSVVDILKFKGKIKFKFYPSKEKVRIWKFDGIEMREPFAEPLRNEIEHFIDCIKNSKTPFTDIEHGLRVIKNMEKYEAEYTMQNM